MHFILKCPPPPPTLGLHRIYNQTGGTLHFIYNYKLWIKLPEIGKNKDIILKLAYLLPSQILYFLLSFSLLLTLLSVLYLYFFCIELS